MNGGPLIDKIQNSWIIQYYSGGNIAVSVSGQSNAVVTTHSCVLVSPWVAAVAVDSCAPHLYTRSHGTRAFVFRTCLTRQEHAVRQSERERLADLLLTNRRSRGVEPRLALANGSQSREHLGLDSACLIHVSWNSYCTPGGNVLKPRWKNSTLTFSVDYEGSGKATQHPLRVEGTPHDNCYIWYWLGLGTRSAVTPLTRPCAMSCTAHTPTRVRHCL